MKLNFEKAVLLVIILIVLISTVNIYGQYIRGIFIQEEDLPVYVNNTTGNDETRGFLTLLLRADGFYIRKDYKAAADEYVSLIYTIGISPQQKIYINFRLGMCYYFLEDYSKARESFKASTEFNTGDAVAYNNAAVCSYLMKDYSNGIMYEKQALDALQIVEFYYNIARMYETIGDYKEAARNYMAVTKAEENISRNDRIDPIRIKNKINQLFPNEEARDKLLEGTIMALKLRDNRDVFLVDDVDVGIESAEFKWRVETFNSTDKLYCTYEKVLNDPYHLIESVWWTVKSEGKTVFTSHNDSFSLKVNPEKKYAIDLKITYSGGKEKRSSTIIKNRIAEPNHDIDTKAAQKCRYYDSAVYEQVFLKDFKISKKGFVDRFGAVWGKDNIKTEIMDKDFQDAGSALFIENTSDTNAGIWADLDTLLKDQNLKGKTVNIKFWARKITENPMLSLKVTIKTKNINNNIQNSFYLDYKWQQLSTSVKIPADADGFTIGLKIGKNEQVKIDGFFITIIE